MNLPHIPGYEFEELIGEGGCGPVYRCRFEEREFRAVKVLNSLAVNPGLLSHALTTVASLPDHPRLAPIHTYNLGQAPYFFATNFYTREGEPATLEPLMGKLRTKQAWKLVEQLIDGLAFLHKNDVVHTGVKPGNIFVEQDSEIESQTGGYRLRLSDPGQGLVAGLHVYEMGKSGFYASPEQLTNGDFSHGKGKRWDVFSFGVVAYQLLTGKLPRLEELYRQYLKDAEKRAHVTAALHREDPMAFFEALQLEPQIKWPSKPKNSFEASLREIVDQCLDLDPSKRPVDLRDVARSFENIRHGADLASLKNRHNARLRSQKIKTKTLILTTGLFLVTSAVLGGAALLGFKNLAAAVAQAGYIKSDWKRDVAGRESKFANERTQLSTAKVIATAERDKQQGLADQARGFLQSAQENADRFFDIVMRAEDVEFPGFQEDRRERLSGGLAYFEAFIEKYDGDAGFARELARAHQFIGEIKRSEGKLTESVASLSKARDLMLALELEGAEKSRSILELARIERNISKIELFRDDLERAADALAASNKWFEELHALAPGDDIAFEILKNSYQLAEIKRANRDVDATLAQLDSLVDPLNDLRDRDPQSEDKKALLARVLSDIGFIFGRRGELDGARQLQQRAAELLGELVEEFPRTDDYQFRLAVCLNQQGNFQDDTRMMKDAHALLAKIVSLNPGSHEYRSELANSYGRMAAIQRAEGHPEEARELNNIAITIFSELLQIEPDIERYKFLLARQNVELAELLADKKEFTEAAKRFDQSIDVFNELLDKEDRNDFYLKELGKTLGNAGFAHEMLGDKPKAKGLYERAQTVWNLFLELQPEDDIAREALDWLKGKIENVS
ncbi:MAG: serine/threonine protein kinase [Verrucomicrobiales bacterium]|jgi:serine/threonine protein kinase